MQISKELMDAFYENSTESLAEKDYVLADFWRTCESMVNNLHHGEDPSIWIPRLKSVIEAWQLGSSDSKLLEAYAEALELITLVE